MILNELIKKAKATTNEMLGAIGRREGIAAQAVVSVYEGEV